MAKEIDSEVEEWYGFVKESPNSNWTKAIYRVRYNDKKKIDIRNVKHNEDGTKMFGKGISLSDEEANSTTEILVENGFGDTDKLKELLDKR